MKFTKLAIGDTFDFVSETRSWNSFFLRCEKIGPRKYKDENGTVYRIGSVNAEVFHVEKKSQRSIFD